MQVRNKGDEVITEHFKEPLKPGEEGTMLPAGKYDPKIQELFRKGILEKILYRNIDGEPQEQKVGNVKSFGSVTVVLPPDDKESEEEAEKENEAVQDSNLNSEVEVEEEKKEESGEVDLYLTEKNGVVTLEYDEADKPFSLEEIKAQNEADLEEAKEEVEVKIAEDGEVVISPVSEKAEESEVVEVSFEVEEDTSEDN